jgi:integrase
MSNSGDMAHLVQEKRSPFWYLRKRDLDSGLWVKKSTGLRIDNAADTRKAQRLAEKASVEEQRIGGPLSSPAFQAWVPGYIATHWQGTGDSKRRYGVAWQAIKAFLNEHGIIYPRQVRYAHGGAYIRWRLATEVHGRKVGHNTALLEVKFLSQLINEAIRREFTESNPIARLGIARTAQKIKPELTDDDIAKIRAKLVDQPEWMRTCFEIALYTGCRFSECSIPIENIDLTAGTIRLRDSKRGENDPRKHFTVPIHQGLAPTLERIAASGQKITCSLSADKNGRINTLFKSAGVEASFHSLRVTFVTRCHRGGLSEVEAKRLVNHSSSLIHRIYSRLNVEDVRAAQTKIPLP